MIQSLGILFFGLGGIFLFFLLKKMFFFFFFKNFKNFWYYGLFWLDSFLFLGILFFMVGSVLFFSSIYMGGEKVRLWSFIFLVCSFVISMVILIISGDWVSLMIGWDWLGITLFF